MTSVMRSIGLARPVHKLTQTRAAEIASELADADRRATRRVNAVFSRSGVDSRGGVTMVEVEGRLEHRWLMESGAGIGISTTTGERLEEFMAYAPQMACDASSRALAEAAIEPDQVTHIVTASCTGMASPGVDHHVIDHLGLPRGTHRTHIGFMGCHAALNAIRVGRAFAEADPDAVVLVCCVELCSLHFQEGISRDAMLANALFADGSAATVITGRTDGAAIAEGGLELIDSSSQFLPDSGELMTWTVTDNGFQMTLDAAVPELLERSVGGWVEAWLDGHGLRIDGVGAWAIHPGGPQIIDAVRDALGIDEAMCLESRAILARHGNMSSPTILYVLDELRRKDAPRPWVALAFGPGLSAEGLLIR